MSVIQASHYLANLFWPIKDFCTSLLTYFGASKHFAVAAAANFSEVKTGFLSRPATTWQQTVAWAGATKLFLSFIQLSRKS